MADAIASPRRRAVIDRLCVGPATTSELAGVAGAALPTMQQHLAILRDARLIRSEKRGRTVTHVLDPQPFEELEDWLATRRSFWTNHLGDLAAAFTTPSTADSTEVPAASETEST